ncbi:hypothetical protein E4U41_000987 [Claviceps citrina]|nr:hypothetical protein E4U41_000987 [Claviceps citrina]
MCSTYNPDALKYAVDYLLKLEASSPQKRPPEDPGRLMLYGLVFKAAGGKCTHDIHRLSTGYHAALARALEHHDINCNDAECILQSRRLLEGLRRGEGRLLRKIYGWFSQGWLHLNAREFLPRPYPAPAHDSLLNMVLEDVSTWRKCEIKFRWGLYDVRLPDMKEPC